MIVMGGCGALATLRAAAPDRIRLAASMLYRGRDRARLRAAKPIARAADVPLIATNDVLYHHPERRPLQDVLTCIREKARSTAPAAGSPPMPSAILKPPTRWRGCSATLRRRSPKRCRARERLTFSLDELRYQYPDEPTGGSPTPQEALDAADRGGRAAALSRRRARARCATRIEHELALIARARTTRPTSSPSTTSSASPARRRTSSARAAARRPIRPSATASASPRSIPTRIDLLFERFISPERNEPPDIDVDFEHERREEVMQYIYDKYGRDRAGIAATVITYRTRSAIREVGKAFGLSEDTHRRARRARSGAGRTTSVSETPMQRAPGSTRTSRTHRARSLELAREIVGFPRHLSQHVGGFVITREPARRNRCRS